MMSILQATTAFFKAFVVNRTSLAAENMAPRHQSAVLQWSVKRPELHKRDRIFWGWLSRLWGANRRHRTSMPPFLRHELAKTLTLFAVRRHP